MDERFRWRTNPAVIAQYYTGETMPKDADVHLRPNEACLVIENGRIVGSATATRLTVNPSLGTLQRLFSVREPFRSFLFVHLGPHDLLLQLNGTWSDGSTGKGLAGLHMRFEEEHLGKLLRFASSGMTTITANDVAKAMALEVRDRFAMGQMARVHPSSATGDPDTATLMEAGLRTIAAPLVADLGGVLVRSWLSWTPSDHDRLVSMRQELQTFAEEGRLIAERDRLEMERLIAQETLLLERQHQVHTATVEYQAKAAAAEDIARLRVKAEKEKEQWAVLTARDRAKAAHEMTKLGLDSTYEDAVSQADHENRLRDIDRIMTLEEKQEELEARRRARKMAVAEEQQAFLRKQEIEAAKHHEEMHSGMFRAMNEANDDKDGA